MILVIHSECTQYDSNLPRMYAWYMLLTQILHMILVIYSGFPPDTGHIDSVFMHDACNLRCTNDRYLILRNLRTIPIFFSIFTHNIHELSGIYAEFTNIYSVYSQFTRLLAHCYWGFMHFLRRVYTRVFQFFCSGFTQAEIYVASVSKSYINLWVNPA